MPKLALYKQNEDDIEISLGTENDWINLFVLYGELWKVPSSKFAVVIYIYRF